MQLYKCLVHPFLTVIFIFSDAFQYVGRSDGVQDIFCDLKLKGTINCNLGNPFLRREEKLQVKIDR